MSFSGSYMAASWLEFEEEEEEEEEDEEEEEEEEGGGGAEAMDGKEDGGDGGGGGGEDQARPVGSWFFTCKMLLSYFGFVMHNTGIWTLLDQYIPNSSFRSVAYMGLGLVGLVLSGAFLPNFALVWPSDEEEVVLEDAERLLRDDDGGLKESEGFQKLISSGPALPTRLSASPSRRTASSASYFGQGSSEATYEA